MSKHTKSCCPLNLQFVSSCSKRNEQVNAHDANNKKSTDIIMHVCGTDSAEYEFEIVHIVDISATFYMRTNETASIYIVDLHDVCTW